jgi:hypothetical protein
MTLLRFVAVSLALLSLAGCSRDALLQKFASAEDQSAAKKYVDYLRAGQYAELEAVMDPGIKEPSLRATLEQMTRLIPDEEPSSVTLVGAETTVTPSGTIKNLTFEYQFADRWLLLNLATRRKDDAFTIVGLHVYPRAQSLDEENRMTLTGKSPGQYLIFALAILLPSFSLYALILCIRTKMERRKWLWILFILFGVSKVAVNWATGEWQVTPLAIQLFSASAVREGYGPWLVGVSLPLGAILFLFRRRTA